MFIQYPGQMVYMISHINVYLVIVYTSLVNKCLFGAKVPIDYVSVCVLLIHA